jgi:hypothetical protein
MLQTGFFHGRMMVEQGCPHSPTASSPFVCPNPGIGEKRGKPGLKKPLGKWLMSGKGDIK